jgi:hypothetical protein
VHAHAHVPLVHEANQGSPHHHTLPYPNPALRDSTREGSSHAAALARQGGRSNLALGQLNQGPGLVECQTRRTHLAREPSVLPVAALPEHVRLIDLTLGSGALLAQQAQALHVARAGLQGLLGMHELV